jgi:hypothetical protein
MVEYLSDSEKYYAYVDYVAESNHLRIRNMISIAYKSDKRSLGKVWVVLLDWSDTPISPPNSMYLRSKQDQINKDVLSRVVRMLVDDGFTLHSINLRDMTMSITFYHDPLAVPVHSHCCVLQ